MRLLIGRGTVLDAARHNDELTGLDNNLSLDSVLAHGHS